MPFVCLVKFVHSTAGISVLGLNTTAEKAARILDTIPGYLAPERPKLGI